MTWSQALGLGGATVETLFAGRARAEGARRRAAHRDRARTPLSLETRLVSEYGVRYPLVSAGMAFVALPELAAAVSNAGGIGIYGAAPEPPAVVDARLADLASRTSAPFGVDFVLAATPLGELTTQEHIEVAVGRRAPIVVFHMDVPPASWVEMLHAAGSRVWVQVGSADAAAAAVSVGADLVIAQGRSAGGHGRDRASTTLALIQAIRARIPPAVLVLAAGGIADGLSLVAALDAGADGAWMGTRFVAATESYAHPEYKARLVAASGMGATEFTTRFGPEFPGQPQRVLANRAVTGQLSSEPRIIGKTTLFPGVVDAPVEMPKYSAFVPTRDTRGDFDEMAMPAGAESVLWITSVLPAAQIVADIIAEAEQVLARGGDRAG